MNRKHVIVGGGPAAISAVETIRQFAPADTIALVSDEPAHSRMALPYWISGKIDRDKTLLGDDAYFQRLGVQTHLGVRAQRIDTQRRRLQLSDGEQLPFDCLLLATGCRPLGLPVPGADLPGVQPMWTLAHTQQALDRLRHVASPNVALVGAGFIGMIVLNAMFKRGWRLEVVEREPYVLPRMLPQTASQLAAQWLQRCGVGLHTGATVTAIQRQADGKLAVELGDHPAIGSLDLVIVATGVQPNVELAERAGIQTNFGILVNQRLETNLEGIYAAGDVAEGPVLFSSQPQVHAIQPTAVDHGRLAGANMAGQQRTYPGSLAMNVLDVCGLQCASYGDWSNPDADHFHLSSPSTWVHRQLVWKDDRLVGAVFAGRAADAGMLTDLGMAKGLIQTGVPLGAWKAYLQQHPFDLRRAYVASGAPARLAHSTLIGRPAAPRQYRHANAPIPAGRGPHHPVFFPS